MRRLGGWRFSWSEVLLVAAALYAFSSGLAALGAPRWAAWPAQLVVFGLLLLVLPWWRERMQQHSASVRRRAAEAANAKRAMAAKCCRNCRTVFANQAPGGSRPEFKCHTCGLTSRKPKLLIPGEAEGDGSSPGAERAAPAHDGRPSSSAKAVDKKPREEPVRAVGKARARRAAKDPASEETTDLGRAIPQAELKERKARAKEEARQRELEEEARAAPVA